MAKSAKAAKFKEELQDLINKYSLEGESDTPDFILADYLDDCLKTFNKATSHRTVWYGPGQSAKNAHYSVTTTEPDIIENPMNEIVLSLARNAQHLSPEAQRAIVDYISVQSVPARIVTVGCL